MHDEQQYLDLIKQVAKSGHKKVVERNNAVTYSVFGHMSRYSLRDGTLPVITTKRIFLRGVIEELLWMLSGDTNSKTLESKGVNIWKGHTSREHLDSCGLTDYEEGYAGPIYGAQWRGTDNSTHSVDQISQVIESLREQPGSRRHVVCAWNPGDIPKMALPPCHCLFQFYIDDEGLSCQLYQRSADIGLGVPFNITSYSLLTHIIAKLVGVPAKEFIHVLGDAHIYAEHMDKLVEQSKREPLPFPKVSILSTDIDQLDASKILVRNYQYHDIIKLDMVV